ncbi:transporter substrate-binding domain-containing protein [Bacillus sp. 03113]|uniref:transporter substrate-binding domain-containing protein n=1 Tax=Bacillus sp. 03113 TaxID=2578211 RepID=UPI0011426EC4|nr:transporter substrate-binding domain-containing protein [Bacillus sp. 03113]
MKKIVSISLIVCFLFGVLTACGTKDQSADKSDKKVLTMGTSAEYPPFEYVDTSKGEDIIGFDIDLAKAIASKLGYEVKVQDMDFNGLIPALEAKKIDFVLAGMTPTEKRKQSVDFSEVYYTAHHMIVSKKESNIKSVEDLNGKTVGVQLTSIQEDKAKELAKSINLKIENRNRIPELIQDIKTGRFDAAIIEDLVAKGFLEKNKDLTGVTIAGSEEEAGSAMAFPKGSKLTEDFNNELKKMKENGELDKLIVKWFGK